MASRLTLSGGRAGELVRVRRHFSEDESKLHEVDAGSGGDVLLEACEYVCVEYEGKSKTFIACVILGG